MTKSKDIPQWAWEKAVFALYGQAPDEWIERQVVIISRCARAILSAVEEEREACALVAAEYYDHPDEVASFIGEEISDAIRSRKEV